MRPLDLLSKGDNQKYVRLHTQLKVTLKESYPLDYSPLSTDEIIEAVTSSQGLLGVDFLANMSTNEFGTSPLTAKKLTLKSYALTGIPATPWVIAKGRICTSGVTGTDLYDKLVRQNIIQSNAVDSNLTLEDADTWR